MKTADKVIKKSIEDSPLGAVAVFGVALAIVVLFMSGVL